MHRVDTDGNVSGLFSDGNPGVAPATVVDATWLNDMQENVAQAVEGAGLTLAKGDFTQLKAALRVFNGDSDETIAARKTSTVPTTRKLIDEWEVGGGIKARLYARKAVTAGGGVNPGLEITFNAVWNGTAWAADDTAQAAILYVFGNATNGDSGQSLHARVNLSGTQLKTTTTGTWTTWDGRQSGNGAITPATGVSVLAFECRQSFDGQGVDLYCELKFTASFAVGATLATLVAGIFPLGIRRVLGRWGDGSGAGDTFSGGTAYVNVNSDGTITAISGITASSGSPVSLAFSASYVLA